MIKLFLFGLVPIILMGCDLECQEGRCNIVKTPEPGEINEYRLNNTEINNNNLEKIIINYDYDSEGYLTTIIRNNAAFQIRYNEAEQWQLENGHSGVIKFYYENQQLSIVEKDLGNDGSIEETLVLIYDGPGNPLTTVEYHNQSGYLYKTVN
ncbi:MAG: hypothetical protein SVR94_07020 [Pseudomonadota bacterium]|nr:hypothetical protein [Pseudomonadota bacterium]